MLKKLKKIHKKQKLMQRDLLLKPIIQQSKKEVHFNTLMLKKYNTTSHKRIPSEEGLDPHVDRLFRRKAAERKRVKVQIIEEGAEEEEEEEEIDEDIASEPEGPEESGGEEDDSSDSSIGDYMQSQKKTKIVSIARPNMLELPPLPKKYNELHISVGFPDSVIQTCQSFVLRNYMLSKIARFCAINLVDELVIVKDHSFTHRNREFGSIESIAKILQYLETPQYLRKALFPISEDLRSVGLTNPLEATHHLKVEEYCLYREGVVLDRPSKDKNGSWVDIGLNKQLILDKKIYAGTRVTVKINEQYLERNNAKCNINDLESDWTGTAVSPLEPKRELGLYWGYKVRTVDYFSSFDRDPPVKGGYQLKILVDQYHGSPLNTQTKLQIREKVRSTSLTNVMVFFSGMGYLDSLIEGDEHSKMSTQQGVQLFDFVVQLDGHYGVRSIHFEEEMMVFLCELKLLLSN